MTPLCRRHRYTFTMRHQPNPPVYRIGVIGDASCKNFLIMFCLVIHVVGGSFGFRRFLCAASRCFAMISYLARRFSSDSSIWHKSKYLLISRIGIPQLFRYEIARIQLTAGSSNTRWFPLSRRQGRRPISV